MLTGVQKVHVLISHIYSYKYSAEIRHSTSRGHHGSDRMVVGFTATCAISAYNH